MAHVGCLGDIPFYVDDDIIKTISNMQQSGSARYAEHKIHLSSPIQEFTGLDADKISFEIVLSAYLGVNPERELAKLVGYERSAKTLVLVIGDVRYGKYRWVIASHTIKSHLFGRGGQLASATISVSLLEYSR